MFIDAREVEGPKSFQRDICIIGAGATGISLALALEEMGIDVDLLESGGFELEPKTQALTLAKLRGGDHGTSRLRFFGGTTNHWGGWCRPLDPFEFVKRAWIPDSGWPINREDLDPYYEAARSILGLPRPHFRYAPSEVGAASSEQLLGKFLDDFEPAVWRRTQPTQARLGPMYRARIERSSRIRCFLNVNVTELIPNREGKAVERVSATTWAGANLEFRARRYVLCTGAIENARLLLLSDSVVPSGLGNDNDLVGRYFADHGLNLQGTIHLPTVEGSQPFQVERFLTARPKEGRTDGVGFVTTPSFRERNRLLGFAAIAFNHRPEDASLAGALTSGSRGDSTGKSGLGGRAFDLQIVAEQSPNRESRVLLDPDKDALGLRKARLELKTTEPDHESRRRSAERLGAVLGISGHGRVYFKQWQFDRWTPGVGGHQTGTARMSDDPKKGVTNRNGRMHGVANLFVTGGALFPTPGWQHPTLTMVALALRLAEFLKSEGSRSDP